MVTFSVACHPRSCRFAICLQPWLTTPPHPPHPTHTTTHTTSVNIPHLHAPYLTRHYLAPTILYGPRRLQLHPATALPSLYKHSRAATCCASTWLFLGVCHTLVLVDYSNWSRASPLAASPVRLPCRLPLFLGWDISATKPLYTCTARSSIPTFSRPYAWTHFTLCGLRFHPTHPGLR